MDIYRELEGMKFGLKEIKQLWNNVLEIAKANGISHKEAVSKFLKDIEGQYDDKLGFESKVNEKRGELVLVNRELSNSRQILWFTPLVGPSLSNLFQKGIGEQDIIGINQLVETCTGNTNFSNSVTCSRLVLKKKTIPKIKTKIPLMATKPQADQNTGRYWQVN